jgi:hypothetical protein
MRVKVHNDFVIVFNESDADALLEEYANAPRDQALRVKALVSRMQKVSSAKRMAVIPKNWKAYCKNLEAKFPNFKNVILYIRGQMSLAARSNQALRMGPILLNGPKGIGKSEFALTLSEDMKTTLKIIDISSSQSGSTLSGSESHWINSQPGLLWTTLVLGDVCNPIIMLDEIDKANGHSGTQPLSALHQLLEKKQSRKFRDLCIPELPIDASNVLWIATSNTTTTLEQQIVDRFTVFEIAEPTPAHMRSIIANQYKKFIDEEPAGYAFEASIRDDVKNELINYHPRKVRKILEMAFGIASYEDREYLTIGDIRACDVGNKPKPGIGFMSALEPTNHL